MRAPLLYGAGDVRVQNVPDAALPRILVGAGQGATLSPLTAAGISGVQPQDAGAASGLVNVAHQFGGSLGLGILVTVFAAAGDGLPHRVSTALTVGTAMLALALALVVALIVRPRRATTTDSTALAGVRAAQRQP